MTWQRTRGPRDVASRMEPGISRGPTSIPNGARSNTGGKSSTIGSARHGTEVTPLGGGTRAPIGQPGAMMMRDANLMDLIAKGMLHRCKLRSDNAPGWRRPRAAEGGGIGGRSAEFFGRSGGLDRVSGLAFEYVFDTSPTSRSNSEVIRAKMAEGSYIEYTRLGAIFNRVVLRGCLHDASKTRGAPRARRDARMP